MTEQTVEDLKLVSFEERLSGEQRELLARNEQEHLKRQHENFTRFAETLESNFRSWVPWVEGLPSPQNPTERLVFVGQLLDIERSTVEAPGRKILYRRWREVPAEWRREYQWGERAFQSGKRDYDDIREMIESEVTYLGKTSGESGREFSDKNRDAWKALRRYYSELPIDENRLIVLDTLHRLYSGESEVGFRHPDAITQSFLAELERRETERSGEKMRRAREEMEEIRAKWARQAK